METNSKTNTNTETMESTQNKFKEWVTFPCPKCHSTNTEQTGSIGTYRQNRVWCFDCGFSIDI